MELLALEKYREGAMSAVMGKAGTLILLGLPTAEIVRKASFFELFWAYYVSVLPEVPC